jgi:hypothetical protein
MPSRQMNDEFTNCVSPHPPGVGCPIHDALFAAWVGYRAAEGRSKGESRNDQPALFYRASGFPAHHAKPLADRTGTPPPPAQPSPHQTKPLALRAVAGCPIHDAPFAAWVGYRAAAGRSAAAGGTTNLLSSAPAHHPRLHKPSPHHAKPLAVRAGPRDRRTLSSPLDPPKSPKPLSILAINLPKTWHSYPLQLSTIEVGPSFLPRQPRPPPGPARGVLSPLKHLNRTSYT